MRYSVILPVLGLAALALSGCSRSTLFNRDTPDEMAVSRKPPLVIPPDFALVPPEAGTPEAQTADLQRQTLDALFGGPAPRSASESANLDAAGNDVAAPGIRSNVGNPGTKVSNKGAATRAILAAPEGDGQNARAGTGK